MIGEKLLHDKKSCSPGSRQSKLASASTNTGTDRMEEPAPTGRPDNGNGKPSMGSRTGASRSPYRPRTLKSTARHTRRRVAPQDPLGWRSEHPEHEEAAGMATDYDAPRVTESDESDTSLEQLTASRKDTQSPVVDVEDTDTAESFELPGADLSGEELTVRVLPKQADEFTCTSCFLVHHRSRLADSAQLICRDCT